MSTGHSCNPNHRAFMQPEQGHAGVCRPPLGSCHPPHNAAMVQDSLQTCLPAEQCSSFAGRTCLHAGFYNHSARMARARLQS